MLKIVFKYFICFCIWIIIKLRAFVLRKKQRGALAGSKVLVIHSLGLGNAVMATPFFVALKGQNPTGTTDILTFNRAAESILKGLGLGGKLMLYQGNVVAKIKLLRKIASTRYNYCFMAFPAFTLPAEVLPLFVSAQFNISHDYGIIHPYFKFVKPLYHTLMPIRESIHDVEQNLSLLDSFAIPEKHPARYPDFDLSAESREFAESYLVSLKIRHQDIKFCIHPGSNKAASHKRWPLENFLALADHLRNEFNTKAIFILGPDEAPLKDEIDRHHFYVLQTGDVEQIAAVIQQCDFFVSNDSAIMHVASLVKVPIFAIWGCTDERRNGARTDKVVNISSDQVTCRPCIGIIPKPDRQCDGNICLTTISVDKVYRPIAATLRTKAVHKMAG